MLARRLKSKRLAVLGKGGDTKSSHRGGWCVECETLWDDEQWGTDWKRLARQCAWAREICRPSGVRAPDARIVSAKCLASDLQHLEDEALAQRFLVIRLGTPPRTTRADRSPIKAAHFKDLID